MSKVTRAFYNIISIIFGISFFGGFLTSSSSALTEESEVDVKFTFNPMLTLSVSSADIIIPNLIPGTSDNSNTVAVTVNTNNISGYSLSATVGNTTNSSRNLVHTALNTNLFSSIDTSSNIASFTTDNTWGYSIDDGAHYSGLPIYTDTPKEIKKTTEAGNSYTNFLIGAKASSTQISGDYTNVINFTVVANPEPIPAIQNLSPTLCVTDSLTTVVDIRDGTEYKVQRLADGKCWMLDNLALDPTDSTTASNMNASNTNASAEAITNYLNGGSSTTGWSSVAVADVDTKFNSLTNPRINNASKDTLVASYGPASTNGQAKVGVYYNFCAATVGTYCYANGSSVDVPDTNIDASQDICPAGWRLPTGGTNGEYEVLYNKYNSTMDATNSASLQYNLSTPLTGVFLVSFVSNQGETFGLRSSTYLNDINMYGLQVSSSDVNSGAGAGRTLGLPVRCIKN